MPVMATTSALVGSVSVSVWLVALVWVWVAAWLDVRFHGWLAESVGSD